MAYPSVLLVDVEATGSAPPLLPPPGPVPPLPLYEPWTRLQMTWTGWNGDAYDLTNPDSGVFLTKGVRGLKAPPMQHYRDSSASVRGSYWRGYIEEARQVFWPTYLYHDESSIDWVARNRTFWKTLHPEHQGVWEVRTDGFSTRRLRLRFESESDDTYDDDPTHLGWAVYGINLVADQPLWEGDDIEAAFSVPGPVDFAGPLGGPPFYISDFSSTSSASIDNPGDVDTHLVWQIHGPHPVGVTVGHSASSIAATFPILDGQTVTIDTRPEYRTATLQDGTDLTGLLGADATWGALPAGESVPLTIEASGEGSVSAKLTPLFWRAF